MEESPWALSGVGEGADTMDATVPSLAVDDGDAADATEPVAPPGPPLGRGCVDVGTVVEAAGTARAAGDWGCCAGAGAGAGADVVVVVVTAAAMAPGTWPCTLATLAALGPWGMVGPLEGPGLGAAADAPGEEAGATVPPVPSGSSGFRTLRRRGPTPHSRHRFSARSSLNSLARCWACVCTHVCVGVQSKTRAITAQSTGASGVCIYTNALQARDIAIRSAGESGGDVT